MGSLPDPTSKHTREELIADLRAGDLQIRGAFDFRVDGHPSAELREQPDVAWPKLREQLEAVIREKRPHLVMVLEARPSREALERVIQELRGALDLCAHPHEGWPETSIADRYEESRILVPEDLDDEDDEAARAEIEQETQASFYPRSRAETSS